MTFDIKEINSVAFILNERFKDVITSFELNDYGTVTDMSISVELDDNEYITFNNVLEFAHHMCDIHNKSDVSAAEIADFYTDIADQYQNITESPQL